MSAVSHAAWTRRGTADTAVLMVHGIVGSPHHFCPFVDDFPSDWTLCSLLLDGHGDTPAAFAAASMATWQHQVDDAFDALCRTHRRVVLVGHSMGCLLLSQTAHRRPPQVAALIFFAPPLHVHVTLTGIRHALRVVTERVPATDAALVASRDAYSIRPDKRLWIYLSYLPRYKELLSLARRVRRNGPPAGVPCTAFVSAKDELVSPRTAKALARFAGVRVVTLDTAMHHYYPDADLAHIKEELALAVWSATP